MKKSTAPNFNQNMLTMAVRFLIMVVAIVTLSWSQNVSAADVCLTGPWATLPDDLCAATVTITPASNSVVSGSSVDIDLVAFTQQQWAMGGWMDIEATLSNGTTLYSYPGFPLGIGINSTVPSGPLMAPVIAHIWGMTNQGVFAEDTELIDVVPPGPTHEINASVTNGAWGSINPSGIVNVNSGANQAFNAVGGFLWYHIDGNSYSATNPYTFNNVVAPHTIQAVLWQDQPGAPGQPFGVTADPESCGAIKVSWPFNNAANMGNTLFRGVATDPRPSDVVAMSLPKAQTSFVDNGPLVPGTRYYYSIEASDLGESRPSYPVSAIAPAACAGVAPNTCEWRTFFDPGWGWEETGDGTLLIGQTQDYLDAGDKWNGICNAGAGANCTNNQFAGNTWRFSCIANAGPSVNLNFSE